MFARTPQVLLLVLSYVSIFSGTHAGVLNPNHRNLVLRDAASGRGFCTKKPGGDPPTKRAVTPLSKRALIPFPQNNDVAQDEFMKAQTDAAQTVIITEVDQDAEQNTAFWRALGATDQVNLEVSKLEGCGVIVVISKKAVYFSHFWESVSFPIEIGADDGGSDYDRNVAGLLDSGLSEPFVDPPPQIQEALKAHEADFRDAENAQAYVIMSQWADVTKEPEANGKILYPTSFDKMAQKVTDITGITPEKITYRVRDDGSVNLETSAFGKVLFQYDPDGANGNPDPAFRLIVERKEFFTQTVVRAGDCVCNENSCNFDCCANGTCPE